MENKHYFLSANTSEGFYNFFDYSLDVSKKGYTYVLKGGSGTGKSTLMRKVGEYFEELGERVEYFHCSSDVSSLDGIRIVDRNVAVLDGTSPHVREANIAGVDSKIINLGDSISDEVRSKRADIEKLVNLKKKNYALVYSALKAAGRVYKLNYELEDQIKKPSKNLVEKILNQLNLENLGGMGSKRQLFRTVMFEDGEINFDKTNSYSKLLKIKAGITQGAQALEEVSNILQQKGYHVICFHDYLSPCHLESLLIEEVDTLIVRVPRDLRISSQSDVEILLDNDVIVDTLLQEASMYLQKARDCHFKIENIYSKFVDFSAHQEITSEIIQDIQTNFRSF